MSVRHRVTDPSDRWFMGGKVVAQRQICGEDEELEKKLEKSEINNPDKIVLDIHTLLNLLVVEFIGRAVQLQLQLEEKDKDKKRDINMRMR